MIFSPFFTRFGRERPAKKPRWAIFSLVFALEIVGETAVFAKDLQNVPILRGQRAVGRGKVGKRVFFAGFPFGLSPVVCTRVRQARSAGCAASRTMKGSWAKSRHVSRNSCALFYRSRAVLSPRTQQPHPRRQGEGGVGEMWPPRRCSGAGRPGRSVAARREGRATRRDGNGTCHRRGAGALLGGGVPRKECGGSPQRESDEAGSEARTATAGATAGTTAVVAGLHGAEVVAGTLAARMAFGALG